METEGQRIVFVISLYSALVSFGYPQQQKCGRTIHLQRTCALRHSPVARGYTRISFRRWSVVSGAIGSRAPGVVSLALQCRRRCSSAWLFVKAGLSAESRRAVAGNSHHCKTTCNWIDYIPTNKTLRRLPGCSALCSHSSAQWPLGVRSERSDDRACITSNLRESSVMRHTSTLPIRAPLPPRNLSY